MALGPGKYDDLCTKVKEEAKASGVIVCVLGGNLGSGFSCQLKPADMLILPMLLRDLANNIEADMRKGKL